MYPTGRLLLLKWVSNRSRPPKRVGIPILRCLSFHIMDQDLRPRCITIDFGGTTPTHPDDGSLWIPLTSSQKDRPFSTSVSPLHRRRPTSTPFSLPLFKGSQRGGMWDGRRWSWRIPDFDRSLVNRFLGSIHQRTLCLVSSLVLFVTL